jgi:alcohol dehydrogenase class IV
LRALGVEVPDIQALAQAALEDGSTLFNPRELDQTTMTRLIEEII